MKDVAEIARRKMGFIGYFDPIVLKSMLRVSNYWAAVNRNQYPVNMTNALSSLYELIPCPCNDQCHCKQYGCTHHYVRKANISFEEMKSHFLSCFVDMRMQNAVALGMKDGRGSKAVEAIDHFKVQWNKLPGPLSTHLLCTEWCDHGWRSLAQSFKATIDTIYKAKWLALLAMDTFVAYDTGSVRLLNREYDGGTYFDLLSGIRDDLSNHLRVNATPIPSFRLYDNPSEFFPKIPREHPRPIGNILDKFFLTL